MSPCESAAPLARAYAIISAAVEVPIATKPAMIASDNQRSRSRSRGRRSSVVWVIVSTHPLGHARASIGRLFAGRPRKKDHTRRDQEVQAAAHPHDQTAKLLIFNRTQRRDARGSLVRRVRRGARQRKKS